MFNNFNKSESQNQSQMNTPHQSPNQSHQAHFVQNHQINTPTVNSAQNQSNSMQQSSVNSQNTNNPFNFAGNTFFSQNTPVSCHCLVTTTATWIIDSGASDHMCHNRSLLFHIQTLQTPYQITLPNGQQISAYEIGSTYIADDVILHNVLHMPHFQFNILSIKISCCVFRRILFSFTGPFSEEASGSW